MIAPPPCVAAVHVRDARELINPVAHHTNELSRLATMLGYGEEASKDAEVSPEPMCTVRRSYELTAVPPPR